MDVFGATVFKAVGIAAAFFVVAVLIEIFKRRK